MPQSRCLWQLVCVPIRAAALGGRHAATQKKGAVKRALGLESAIIEDLTHIFLRVQQHLLRRVNAVVVQEGAEVAAEGSTDDVRNVILAVPQGFGHLCDGDALRIICHNIFCDALRGIVGVGSGNRGQLGQ